MIMRDTLTQIIPSYEPDGQGGRVLNGQTSTEIKCRASLNTSPEVASAYGTDGEQILYTYTFEALDEEAQYFFANKKFTVRHSSPSNRLFYSILIEVKE